MRDVYNFLTGELTVDTTPTSPMDDTSLRTSVSNSTTAPYTLTFPAYGGGDRTIDWADSATDGAITVHAAPSQDEWYKEYVAKEYVAGIDESKVRSIVLDMLKDIGLIDENGDPIFNQVNITEDMLLRVVGGEYDSK